MLSVLCHFLFHDHLLNLILIESIDWLSRLVVIRKDFSRLNLIFGQHLVALSVLRHLRDEVLFRGCVVDVDIACEELLQIFSSIQKSL